MIFSNFVVGVKQAQRAFMQKNMANVFFLHSCWCLVINCLKTVLGECGPYLLHNTAQCQIHSILRLETLRPGFLVMPLHFNEDSCLWFPVNVLWIPDYQLSCYQHLWSSRRLNPTSPHSQQFIPVSMVGCGLYHHQCEVSDFIFQYVRIIQL